MLLDHFHCMLHRPDAATRTYFNLTNFLGTNLFLWECISIFPSFWQEPECYIIKYLLIREIPGYRPRTPNINDISDSINGLWFLQWPQGVDHTGQCWAVTAKLVQSILAQAPEATGLWCFSVFVHGLSPARMKTFPSPPQSHWCPAQAMEMCLSDPGCKSKLSVAT